MTGATSVEELARRARWELSTGAAGIGTYVLHLPSGFMDMDKRARELAGLQGTDPIRPEDVYANIPAEEVTGVAAAIDHALATAGTFSAEHRMVYPDGSFRWVAVHGQTLSDAAGTVTALVGALYDITALREATAQQAALVTIARALGDAETETDVLTVVAGQGAQLLGANGSALCLREPDGTHMRILTTDTYSDEVRQQVQRVPVGFPLPLVHTAATGTALFHGDRAETVAMFPGGEDIYAAAAVQASAGVPLRAHGHLLGSLSLGFARARTWRREEQDLLEAFAALTAQALDRLRAREAQRVANVAVARFSETLQRSLLTSPAEPDHLQIAVRYVPATAEAQVGGDWYDAFITGDGTTNVVIGDVGGHDQDAAAAMGQLRNLLRGIRHAIGDAPPAAVLSALDRAVRDLDVPALATIVLAQVEQTPEHRAAGTRLLRWCNAGHPPPLLLDPAAGARFLEFAPDLLIGVEPNTSRSDHTVVLEPGSTVLLYTDGLIERRGASLDAGLAWLAETVTGLGDSTLDQLCDHLLAAVGGRVEDDVALLAVRAHPEDKPRPADAGPAVDPRRSSTLESDLDDGGERHA